MAGALWLRGFVKRDPKYQTRLVHVCEGGLEGAFMKRNLYMFLHDSIALYHHTKLMPCLGGAV